jgi:DNA-binding CsgD family transcriptional regulator
MITAVEEGAARLTPREKECLRLVAAGRPSKDIGRRLGISQHTVDGYLDEARRKLGATDRFEAARRFRDAELHAAVPSGGPRAVSGGQTPRLGAAPPPPSPDPDAQVVPPPAPAGWLAALTAGEGTPLQRLAAILAIALGSTLALILLVWGAHAFTVFIQQLAEGSTAGR